MLVIDYNGAVKTVKYGPKKLGEIFYSPTGSYVFKTAGDVIWSYTLIKELAIQLEKLNNQNDQRNQNREI
jgi:hypothetical protein